MIYSGFLLGFLGSFHCLAMCGPIALALNGKGTLRNKLIANKILYNLGRTFTYVLLGLFVGLIGEGANLLWGYQLYLSVLFGIGLVLIGIFAHNPEKLMTKVPVISGFFDWIRKELTRHIKKERWDTHFTIGLLNGFLPCGLVYMGLAGALATGKLIDSMLYMAFFGLGTFPMLLGISVAGKWINLHLRKHVSKLYPFIFILLGVFFIVRGFAMHNEGNPAEVGQVEVCY